MNFYKPLGYIVFGFCLAVFTNFIFFTGDDPPRWEKFEIMAYGKRTAGLGTQCYLVYKDKDGKQYESNCPNFLRIKEFNKLYWCKKASVTWKHKKSYIFDVESAVVLLSD